MITVLCLYSIKHIKRKKKKGKEGGRRKKKEKKNKKTYLILLVKYYLYICKFKNELPNATAFKSFVKKQKEIEYFLARKNDKLPVLFRKWRFNL